MEGYYANWRTEHLLCGKYGWMPDAVLDKGCVRTTPKQRSWWWVGYPLVGWIGRMKQMFTGEPFFICILLILSCNITLKDITRTVSPQHTNAWNGFDIGCNITSSIRPSWITQMQNVLQLYFFNPSIHVKYWIMVYILHTCILKKKVVLYECGDGYYIQI